MECVGPLLPEDPNQTAEQQPSAKGKQYNPGKTKMHHILIYRNDSFEINPILGCIQCC